MKKSSLLALLIFIFAWAIQTSAKTISEQEAYQAAQQFFTIDRGLTKSSTATGVVQLAHTSTGYYAFNRGENDGFVLVATDDCFSSKILGYADKGTFDINNIPDNMRWWLGEYDRALNATQTLVDKPLTKSVQIKASQTERAEIAPLVTAQWDQSSPYNDMCPVYNGIQCPTGCLATALAQIIYCNKYPTQGSGSYSYDWKVELVTQKTLSVNFDERIYNYDIMCDTYDESSSAESRQAVAQLMFDLGVLSEMAYKPAISSAPTFTALLGLVRNLQYDKSAIIRSREFYTDKEWIDMVYANLAEGYPLLYTGQNEWAGHAFVCDGYRNGYFHINWGWSGGSNGYFLLDGLNPGSQGIGGSSGGYNSGQEAIFNLRPAQPDSKYEILLYNYNNFDIEEKGQNSTSTATFTGAFCNLGIAGQTIVLGLKVVDSEGSTTWIQELTSSHINSLADAKSIVVDLSHFPSTEGEYRVYPAYQDENGVWKEMRTKTNFSKRYLTATVSGQKITFAHTLKFSDWTISEEVIAEKEFSIQVTIQNETGSDCTDHIKLALMEYGGSNIVDYSNEVEVSIPNGNSITTTFELTAPKAHGFYNYFAVNSKGETISEISRVAIEENTETTEEFTLSLNSVEVVAQATDNVNITAEITCEGGRYNGFIGFFIFPESGGYYVDYIYENFFIKEGETKTISNTGEFYGLTKGKTYYTTIYYNDFTSNKWITVGMADQRKFFTVADPSSIEEIPQENILTETSVYNLSGIRLLHFEAGVPLDTSSLEPGIYIVKSGNATKRIIIHH